MSNPLLLLHDFLLILLGWWLCRRTSLNRSVWEAVERLVYFLLFPVLLFNSIAGSPLQPAEVAGLAAAALGTLATGIALALALGRWPGVSRAHRQDCTMYSRTVHHTVAATRGHPAQIGPREDESEWIGVDA